NPRHWRTRPHAQDALSRHLIDNTNDWRDVGDLRVAVDAEWGAREAAVEDVKFGGARRRERDDGVPYCWHSFGSDVRRDRQRISAKHRDRPTCGTGGMRQEAAAPTRVHSRT